MGRAWLLAILSCSVSGCYSPETLENAPCEIDEDCLRGYRCIKTLHQQAKAAAGWCRNDGRCAEGEQEGCLAADGGECPRADLTPVDDPTSGNTFCCRTNDSIDPWIHIASSDFSSALCGGCPDDLCPEDRVPCRTGEPRCELVEDLCGCRTTDAQVENSECASDQTCGEGFGCTRTLEQEAEPLEADPSDQEQEPGWCRPLESPGCVGGQQEGCRTDAGCVGPEDPTCTAEGLCYCCGASSSADVGMHVYAVDAQRSSAACIECPRAECTAPLVTCTVLEDPQCEVLDGVCGCAPGG